MKLVALCQPPGDISQSPPAALLTSAVSSRTPVHPALPINDRTTIHCFFVTRFQSSLEIHRHCFQRHLSTSDNGLQASPTSWKTTMRAGYVYLLSFRCDGHTDHPFSSYPALAPRTPPSDVELQLLKDDLYSHGLLPA